ncbi:MAG TPA: hypothetical protein VLL25_03205 [Acidimicrobiales bacterium]|nr:hypothetical protein [Acidimicrobiales bacterium]
MKLEQVVKAGIIGLVVFGLLAATFLVLGEESGALDTFIAAIDGLIAGLVAYAIQVLKPEASSP